MVIEKAHSSFVYNRRVNKLSDILLDSLNSLPPPEFWMWDVETEKLQK